MIGDLLLWASSAKPPSSHLMEVLLLLFLFYGVKKLPQDHRANAEWSDT